MTPRCLICGQAYPDIASPRWQHPTATNYLTQTRAHGWLCATPECYAMYLDATEVAQQLTRKLP